MVVQSQLQPDVVREAVMSTQTLPRTPRDVRELIRSGTWRGVTSGIAPGYVQANLAILPRELAFDFLLFCQRNPKPCPLLEVMEPGRIEPALTAPSAIFAPTFPVTGCTRMDGW